MKLIRWFINNPVSVNLLVGFLIIAGLLSLSDIRREIFPPFSLDRILVSVIFPGASPEEVEEGICVKIEEGLSGLAGIKKLSSTARESSGNVIIEIETGEDIELLKDDVETRINAINTFPRDAERPIVQKLELIRQVLHLAISGDVSEETLRNLAEEVKKDLLAFPEISQITIDGLKDFEISIELSESRMREFGITFDEVARVIRNNSLDLSAGVVRTSSGETLLRVKGQKYVRQEFEDIVIRTNPNGAAIKLHQIGKIKDTFAETQMELSLNGRRAGLVSVFKTEAEDIIRISDRVKAYTEQKRRTLPPSVTLEVLNDTSTVVRSRLDLLKRNGIQGLLLVFLCLTVFLSVRLSFWVSFGIPVSMLGTFILLHHFDQSLNMMSMFGLIMALGMLVDDAIVVSESIFTHIQRNPAGGMGQAALEGTIRVFWPILASVSTTIVAFLPLAFMTGIMGKFIMILPITVISCLMVSLIEALIGLPCHLAHHLTLTPAHKTSSVRRALEAGISRITETYTRLLQIACEFRYGTLGLAFLIFLFALGMFRAGWINFVLFPRGDSDAVSAKIEFPEGSPFAVTQSAVKTLKNSLDQAQEELKKSSGSKDDFVKHAFAISGQQAGFERMIGANIGEITVELVSSEERSITSAQLLNTWRSKTPPIPGVKSLLFSEQERGPGGKPLEVQLRGSDFSILQEAAVELKSHLRTFPGLFDIDDDFKSGVSEIRLNLKPTARSLGLSLADLAGQVRQAFYGNEVLRLQRGRFDVKVFLRFPERERRFLATLENMIIRGPTGGAIPLSEVAEIVPTAGTSLIKRMDGHRLITVVADVDENKANADRITQNLVNSGFLDNLEKKYRIRYAFEGQKKETMESFQGLQRGFALSFVGIFIILATIFGSYMQPLIIMVAIPFGIIGALFGHLIMGYPLTMLSLFGLVALSGIVVNNSLLIIDFINIDIANGATPFQAVIDAGRQRLRPILLTTLTTILGISTLMMERSFQAQFLIPMAISIAWGLMFSTALTLFLVPSLYLILNDVLALLFRIWEGRWPEAKELIGGSDTLIPEEP
jgi:multidrug efflux pump subunit AcrB